MKTNQVKATKWTNTDKKIKQIIIDLYTNNKYYERVYESVENFYNIQHHQYHIAMSSYFKDQPLWFEADQAMISENWINMWEPNVRNWSIHEKLFMFPGFLNWDESEDKFLNKVWEIRYTSQFVQEKYNISNVTIKSRLANYFWLEVIHEWKIGRLNLILRYDVMVKVAIQQYIENYPNSFLSDIVNFNKKLSEL